MSGFCVDPLASRSKHKEAPASPSAPQKDVILVNRAPVLTLWAAIVAERLGHPWDAALGFGKAVAGLCAQRKGRSIGVYEEKEESGEERPSKKRRKKDEVTTVKIVGVGVPAKRVDGQLLAHSGGAPLTGAPVEAYLRRSFGGQQYERAQEAMRELAQQFEPGDLNAQGFRLYERFRPSVAGGKAGWGAKGVLDLDAIKALADDMRAANELAEESEGEEEG